MRPSTRRHGTWRRKSWLYENAATIRARSRSSPVSPNAATAATPLNYSSNKGKPRYQCSLYGTKGKGYCKSHFITYDDLYNAVLHDIKRRAKAAAYMDKHLLMRLEREASGLLNKKEKTVEKERRRMTARIDELDAVISKLYEDSTLGRVPPERCHVLMEKFEAKSQRDEMQKTLDDQKKRRSEMAAFLKVIAGYQSIEGLTATILGELISEIRVGVKETVDGKKKQRIKIIYNQACYVDYFDDGELNLSEEDRTEFLALDAEMEKRWPTKEAV